ncbi:hypothetical protein LINPERPRIM_LOCUS22141 [Linum perenne]
MYFVLH